LSAISAELTTEKSNAGRAIFLGGVAAGILDITAAFVNTWIQTGRSPRWVLQSIASGFLGAESYKGGWTTAALGAVLHFTVAFVSCTVFYLATGFHGLHVTGGLVAFLFVLGRTFVARKFTHEQAVTAIVVSYYWHFVDIVWIALFATVYLIK